MTHFQITNCVGGGVLVEVASRRTFEAAHSLPKMPPDHKCHRLHGHNYVIEVVCRGELNAADIVIDYGLLDAVIDEIVVKQLDHRYLNDIEGLESPTGEVIALWCLRRLQLHKCGDSIYSVTVWETPHYRATVYA